MSSIHCCGAKRAARSFVLAPQDGFLFVKLSVLDNCHVCNHFVVELFRVDYLHNVTRVRKTNLQARKFFDKLKTSIMYEYPNCSKLFASHGTFYLNYNEFGKTKRCYSNLSTLKMGLFDNNYNYCALSAKKI